MKGFLKIFVPIMLAVTIIACGIWYLFVYDRDFAKDLLLEQARYHEQEGRHDIAAWLYDQAYAFSGRDEAVAIELAEQFKANGNYTRAEYTLSRAIADGGSARLYIALCQTYVEQNKLLDAVTMLDRIADPAIKAQLDAMRPAAPTFSVSDGYYTEYIDVEVFCQTGTLYVSSDGQIPSMKADVYTGPLSLPQGQTLIYALAVSEDNLVSPLALHEYIIGGIIEPVRFADPAMEEAIRQLLGFDADDVIYTNDLWSITQFTVPAEAEVYDDLARMPYLQSLTIYNAKSTGLGFLSALHRLETLLITGCPVGWEDLRVIAGIEPLTSLTLADCDLTNIEPLSQARNLQYLDLSNNTIRDLTPLGSVTSLTRLYLYDNAISDLIPLGNLTNLITLNIGYNSITTLQPLHGATALVNLLISNNLLTDLEGVQHLTALENLDASVNHLTDISTVSGCGFLTELNVSFNELTDISAVASAPSLRELNFAHNQVTALPVFGAASALVIIDGSYNQLTNLDILVNLPFLNKIIMDYNSGITNVDSLIYCPNLLLLDIFGTSVTDISAFDDSSVTVHYGVTIP